jgi:hypothetical protein
MSRISEYAKAVRKGEVPMPGILNQRYARDRELYLAAQARGDIPSGCVLHMRLKANAALYAYWPGHQNGDRYYIDPEGNVEFEQKD